MSTKPFPSPDQTGIQFNKFLILVPYTFVLLLLFFSAVYQQPHSITSVEAHTLWLVQDERHLTDAEKSSPRLIISAAVGQMRRTLDRSLNDGQPPLYFALLEVWTWLAGDSRAATRLLSALLVLLAIFLLFTITARRLRAAGMARSPFLITAFVALAALAPPTVYMARSAEPAAMLMFASALNLWLLLRWMAEPGIVRSLLYSLSLGLALYTHLLAVLLIGLAAAVQMIRLVRGESLRGPVQWDRLWVRTFTYGIIRWMLSVALAVIAFLPLFFFLTPPDTLADSGLALWGLLLPWLVAFGLVTLVQRFQSIETVRLTLSLMGISLLLWLAYPLLLPAAPDWDQAVAAIVQGRHPLEPLVIGAAPDSPTAYTLREADLSAGIRLDVGWHDFSPAEHTALAGKLTADRRVWLVMPSDSEAYHLWRDQLTAQGRSPLETIIVDEITIQYWTEMQ